MRVLYVLVLCSLLAFLSACTTTSPKVSYYIIQVDETLTPLDLPVDDISIAIGPAEFPTYLRRNQFVSRNNNRLIVNEYHRWGSSFESTVLTAIGENVRQLLNTSRVVVYPSVSRFELDYRLVMDVVQFDGQRGGEVVLNVRWMVLDRAGRTPLFVKQTKLMANTSGSSYDDLVSAHATLLTALSKEMASAVYNLRRGEQ